MRPTETAFDAVRSSTDEEWAATMAGRNPASIAVLFALADMAPGADGASDVVLTPEARALLIDRLSDGRLVRPRFVRRANELLPGVARLLGVPQPPPITSDNFGVILYRVRRRLFDRVRRACREARSPTREEVCNKRRHGGPKSFN